MPRSGEAQQETRGAMSHRPTRKGGGSCGPTFIPALPSAVYDCGDDASPTRADGRVLARSARADVNAAPPLNNRARAGGARRECASAHEI